jgi:anaerobic ribonucleoside-triphosphate reductase activating protein
MMLNLHGTLPRSLVNGPGERTVVHLQGCSLHCPGCFNQWSWPTRPHEMVDPERLADQLLQSNNRVTISGGEPMDQPGPVCALVRALRMMDPDCSILMFTGYTVEQLDRMVWWEPIREQLDIAVSGPYRKELQVRGAPLIGSSNQQILMLSGRHTWKEILMEGGPGPTVEAHVAPDGTITITGFPPDRAIEELRSQEDE